MARVFRLGLFAASSVLVSSAACGLDVIGIGATDLGDGGAIAPDATTIADAMPLPACDAGSSCSALGTKWRPVAVAIGPSAATCPFGDAEVLRTNPDAGAGACTCQPTNVVPPICNRGNVVFTYGNGSSCPSPAGTYAWTTSDCVTVSGPLTQSVAFTPLAPSGGGCEAQSVADPAKVTSDALSMCAPACAADICSTKKAPAGFRACVVADGDVACDVPGFGEKHVAGATATVSCSACTGCTATATCSNVSVDLFSNNTCTTKLVNVPAATCANTGGSAGQTVRGMVYNANATPTYTATGPNTPTPGLTGVRTVCCAS